MKQGILAGIIRVPSELIKLLREKPLKKCRHICHSPKNRNGTYIPYKNLFVNFMQLILPDTLKDISGYYWDNKIQDKGQEWSGVASLLESE
jgi:hypothetical protein